MHYGEVGHWPQRRLLTSWINSSFCKIWDERWRDNDPKSKGQPYNFQIIHYPEDPQNNKAKVELEARIRNLYEHGRKKDPEVFKDDIKLDKHKIYTVVQYLQDINLSKTDLDAKGLAFQSFMGNFSAVISASFYAQAYC